MILTRYIRRHFIEKAVRAFQPLGSVLEIGSGTRWRYFDGSTTLNRDASAKADILCDAEALALADGSFPNIACIEVLEHTLSPETLISEIHRVLEPGGKLLLTVPFVFEVHDARDYYRFTRMGLEHLLRDFSDIKIEPNGGVFCVLFHFIRLSIFGKLLYPVLNNLGYGLDCLFQRSDPRITLGYTVVATK
ncbi:methyltransferase domain-containing protein [Nisaea sp.]|uniref:class I SAM-dependent methyltransferase n=1 Tax=Nisaea sp. TaxID=2024842 RepID=UPI0032983743